MNRPRIGLALGGGGARGLAHFGVLERLREMGVQLHCIAGTSIGAIVGAIAAADTLDEAIEWCRESDWIKLPKLLFETSLTTKALIPGNGIENVLRSLIKKRDFTELSLPFAAVATDLDAGTRVVMRDGDLIEAVRASMSIPGVFRPISRNGRTLIDGGLVDPVPVAACREMGADFVIAVDINSMNPNAPVRDFAKRNIFDILISTFNISQSEIARRSLIEDHPDLIIRPAVSEIMILDFRNAMNVVALGRNAVPDEIVAHRRLV